MDPAPLTRDKPAVSPARRALRPGFTLIELLIVLVIIALLMAMLVPALNKGRKQARRVASLSNVRQISAATLGYRNDFKAYMPVTLTYSRGSTPWSNYDSSKYTPATFSGSSTDVDVCRWQFGGKNCNKWWRTEDSGSYDVEAADRPLNPYMMPGVTWDAPAWAWPQVPTGLDLPADAPSRAAEAPPFRDPSDRVTYQRDWPAANYSITSYNDVGTSYDLNIRWLDQALKLTGGQYPRYQAFTMGARALRQADSYQPSRFVWIHDPFGSIVACNPDHSYKIKNGYEEYNKAVLGMMDGSARYVALQPGNDDAALRTDSFSFVFEFGPYAGK